MQPGPKNTIVVSFIPKEAGTYYIHINKQGKAVSGSPFEVNVKPEDIAVSEADASKVKCSGKGMLTDLLVALYVAHMSHLCFEYSLDYLYLL